MRDWSNKVTPGVKLAEGNSSGYVGVYFDRAKNGFRSEFWYKGKRLRSKVFESAEDAAKLYDERVRELRGPGYPVNFPISGERGFIKDVDLNKFCARGHPRDECMYTPPNANRAHCRECNKLAVQRMHRRKKDCLPERR